MSVTLSAQTMIHDKRETPPDDGKRLALKKRTLRDDCPVGQQQDQRMQTDGRADKDVLPEAQHKGGNCRKKIGTVNRPVENGHQPHIDCDLSVSGKIDGKRREHDEQNACHERRQQPCGTIQTLEGSRDHCSCDGPAADGTIRPATSPGNSVIMRTYSSR